MTDFDTLLKERHQRKHRAEESRPDPGTIPEVAGQPRVATYGDGRRELVWIEDDVLNGLETGVVGSWPVDGAYIEFGQGGDSSNSKRQPEAATSNTGKRIWESLFGKDKP